MAFNLQKYYNTEKVRSKVLLFRWFDPEMIINIQDAMNENGYTEYYIGSPVKYFRIMQLAEEDQNVP